MLYGVLRWMASLALHWFYADVEIHGREQLPARGPLLLVANHPNALMDALAVSVSVPRRVRLTAKATLFEHPLLAAVLRAVGVIPLRRAKDERVDDAAPSATRNADAFQAATEALARGRALLVFPEGISHDAPALAPLRTGAARMALMSHAAGVAGVRVAAIGLTYERKEQPRSRLLVRFGEPLDVDAWLATHGTDVNVLTAALEDQLRGVTLNFASEEQGRRALQLARALAAIASEVPSLDRPPVLLHEAELARRIDAASDALTSAPPAVARAADAFVAEVEALERSLAARGVFLSELHVSPAVRPGTRFVVREALFLALALPVAIIDRGAHDLPLRLARFLARRSLATDPSRDQPAMRTVVLAAALLLGWYLVLGLVIALRFGVAAAILVLVTMLLSAGAGLALHDRVTRAVRRARTYLAFRADPSLRSSARARATCLLDDARALEQRLVVTPERASVSSQR